MYLANPIQRRPALLRRGRGVTLIMVAGVLAVLAALGTGFYTMMVMQTKSSVRYSDSVRAEMLARAGIEEAVARVRDLAYRKTEDPTDPWYMADYRNGGRKGISFAYGDGLDNDNDGIVDNEDAPDVRKAYSRALGNSAGAESDRFVLSVSDAASKINVNTGDNLAVILDNLCRLIGPPLVACNQDKRQPRRWSVEGADAGLYDKNPDDKADGKDIYFKLGADGRPVTDATGVAVFGDGYAIAGHRARNGRFNNLSDVKAALTYVARPGQPELEEFEREVKFAALRDYITIDSWVDTNTVCVGKFEWAHDPNTSGDFDLLIDRDKSWASSVDAAGLPIADPLNKRGFLRGCYVSIMNGHGAGQLRRIKENGIDWLLLEKDKGMKVPPGPISSYMIIARPDATPDPMDPTISVVANRLDFKPNGDLQDDPNIDYSLRPLCIHRAPVNINTASDKVLAALLMGVNVQHGHPMAIGTDADRTKIVPSPLPDPPLAGSPVWKTNDYFTRGLEPYLLTLRGLKRLPGDSGKIVFDRAMPTPEAGMDIDYLNNHGLLDPAGTQKINEAQELAYRIIIARQKKDASGAALGTDPLSGYERGPFTSYDDFYFRVVKPWDDEPARFNDPKKVSVARMIMANCNSNTDILKFNPNIEWIDRWGRNFTEMEPVMVTDIGANEPKWVPYVPWPATAASDGMWNSPLVSAGKQRGSYYTRALRYKSDEVIDKTDLNRSTTEFIFDSAGIFHIVSVGQVMRRGEVLAERKLEALVKVYDVWRESTQAQFVRGSISESVNSTGPVTDPVRSGKVVRDSANTSAPFKRLALDTLPEPLTPLGFTINNPNGLSDLVSGSSTHYDAFGNSKTVGVPDAVANRVLPASYDGQIVLATNTCSYDTGKNDTFLASFNGDLDTDTSAGNGREQAKTPADRKVRVLDTIGLLGRLNDLEVDFDPKTPVPGPDPDYDVFAVKSANAAMRSLDPQYYWENVTCRMGDLRPDGVYMGNVGISGKDATIKYQVAKNFPIATADNKAQFLVRMWYKSNWHITDGQEHEFWNACNTGDAYVANGCYLRKAGSFSGVIRYGAPGATNGAGGGGEMDLQFHTEDINDRDMIAYQHGGFSSVPTTTAYRESPSYRVQPFRWGFVGCMANYFYSIKNDPTSITTDADRWSSSGQYDTGFSSRGRWQYGGGEDPVHLETVQNRLRIFIDTQRNPEGSEWSGRYHKSKINQVTMSRTSLGVSTTTPQMAAWNWSDGANSANIFGINNLNRAMDKWLYRSTPIDGTQAVVDELKVSVTALALDNACWVDDRVATEQVTSRYYLPSDPADTNLRPTFTSQTLLQSIRGFDKISPPNAENVTLVRVSWNVFTPRFLHENKDFQTARTREEVIGDRGGAPPNNSNAVQAQKITAVKYKGPFDYIQYNHDIMPRPDARPGEQDLPGNKLVTVAAAGETIPVLHADRPSRKHYPGGQAHASRGVDVELLKDEGSGTPTVLAGPFVNPDAVNSVGSVNAPVKVGTHELRYRVRFRYPVDPLIAGVYQEPAINVDPLRHYLLDTPVFDDISVTYMLKPRILSFREVTE